MHYKLPLLLVVVLGVAAPARAQIFQVTVDGKTTYAGLGIYSAVPAGTAFTFTETFNAATSSLVSSTGSSATYADPDGASSFSFDGFNYSGTAPQIVVTSNELDDGVTLYGFDFNQFLGSGDSYGVQLLSVDSSVAPTTSLDSLQTSPISDFNNSLNLAAVNGDGGSAFDLGTTTSFSVQVESAPEPSSIVLFALAIPILWWLRSRQQRENIAT